MPDFTDQTSATGANAHATGWPHHLPECGLSPTHKGECDTGYTVSGGDIGTTSTVVVPGTITYVGLARTSHSSQESAEDIEHRFAFHAATDQEKRNLHTSAREVLRRAAQEIDSIVPNGREKSLTLTKLEEAMFWANAGLARNS